MARSKKNKQNNASLQIYKRVIHNTRRIYKNYNTKNKKKRRNEKNIINSIKIEGYKIILSNFFRFSTK